MPITLNKVMLCRPPQLTGTEVVQMLLGAVADVNTRGPFGNALPAASWES